MSRVTLLILAVFTTLTVASEGGAGTPVSGTDLMVMDGAGREVGGVFDVDASGYYYVTVVTEATPGVFVKMNVWQQRVEGESMLYFQSRDCTGPAFFVPIDDAFSDPRQSIFPWASVGPPGLTVYVADKNAPLTSIEVNSSYRPISGCEEYPLERMAVPAMAVTQLDFTPPFRVGRKSISGTKTCCGDCNADGEVKINEVIGSVTRSLEGCPSP